MTVRPARIGDSVPAASLSPHQFRQCVDPADHDAKGERHDRHANRDGPPDRVKDPDAGRRRSRLM